MQKHLKFNYLYGHKMSLTRANTKTIILDTNFLLIPGTLGVDIFSEIERIVDSNYEIAVLSKTIDELDAIIDSQRLKYKRAAQLAKQLIKAKNLKILHSTSQKLVDDILVDMALSNEDIIIATQDKALKRRLKNKKIITLKQEKYLIFV